MTAIQFWLGKAAAEVVCVLIAFAAAAVLVGIAILIDRIEKRARRKKK